MATKKAASSSKRSGRTRPWWKTWWAALLVLPALLLGLVGLIVFFVVFATIPLPEDIAAASTVVIDADGREVGTLNAEVARTDVDLEELPEHISYAVLAAEDRNFHEHGGISATGILRAIFTNARAGEIQQGGSTITQQYIKNAVVGSERTLLRKVREASLAIKLERQYDKDTILELYLNSIYWGRGAYGIEAAARTYFGRPAEDLTVNQAALLAGIIQAPERLDPIENPEGADNRRIVALDGMLEMGWLDEQKHAQIVNRGLPEVTERTVVNRGPNAYFIDAIRHTLVNQVEAADLFRGLRIHTTLDQDIQAAAETALATGLAGQDYTGAIVIVDPATGAVRALVGGPDITRQPYNTAIREPRQVGSSFKTVTLAAWVEDGLSVRSQFPGPATYEVPDGTGGTHEVRNYDNRSYGTRTVRDATRASINTVYVQMQEELGAERVIDMAANLGLPTERSGLEGQVMEPVPTLTLGVASFTPLEMAAAYATLAANGSRSTTHLVTRVVDLRGDVIWEPELQTEQAMSPGDAALVTDVLRDVVSSGTGRSASIGRPQAGKTGTTNDNRNVWFAGYTPQLSAAVWIGNLDNSPTDGLTGGSVPAQVWADAMAAAHEGLEVLEFPPATDDGEVLNGEPEECEDGYERRHPPDSVDDNGWYPDIQSDTEDAEGRPCVEVSPSPSPTTDPGPTQTEDPQPPPKPPGPKAPPLPGEPDPSPSPSPSPTPDPEPTTSPAPSETPTGG
ncbi:MAG: PBP1A family penicillin-binding protein [Nitriliruptorales bacterium]|nr:PBP1A family penicillin-binding protein [Nitriliruptorales bacterium]